MANLLAKKPLNLIMSEAHETGEHSLKRALGPGNLISLGIGAIIGTGIFVLTGAASAQYAGPAIVFSFMLAAVGCVFAGLCYAEFASMIPIAGSAYTYGYATLGEIFAWIIGWDLILEYAFGAATVASGWSGYVLSLLQDFHIHIPPWLAGTPGAQFVQLPNGRWEALGRISKTLAASGIDPSTLPHQTGVFNLVAFLGIAAVTAILVIGIKESANANSLIVVIKVCVLLIFIALGTAYILRHTSQAVANWTPFLPPNQGEFGKYGWSGVVRAAGVVFFSMSKDRLLPEWFCTVHTKCRTPYISSIFVGIFVAIFASVIPIAILGELVSIGTLLAFVIVCAGVWMLRRTDPELPRPFKTPLVPFVPIMGALISLLMMAGLPGDTWLRLIIWLIIGMGIYFSYGRHHSRVQLAEATREPTPAAWMGD